MENKKEWLAFTKEEAKLICKRAANGDYISQKVMERMDSDVTSNAMNEFIEEETGKEYGDVDSSRKYTDEELELICKEFKNNKQGICVNKEFGIDDKKRFNVIKEVNEGKEVAGKIRNFPDRELMWIYCGVLEGHNSAINLWGGLQGTDDEARYNEIGTVEWNRPFKKRDHIELILNEAKKDVVGGMGRAIEFAETLTGGDLYRFNKIKGE